MTRDQQIARAHVLRDRGDSYKAIGAAVGVSANTAYRWFNPGYDESNRQQQRERSQRVRDAQPHATATCGRCRARLLREAPLCGLCLEEMALARGEQVAA